MAKPLRSLLVFGTRPEAIKMAPVVQACQAHPGVDAVVCLTGQHREMLQQVTDYFKIEADYDLNLMRPSQSLATLTARCLESLAEVVEKSGPDCIVAQGDTTSVLAASMIAFYHRLPFVHVEAGLRTGDLWAPWPEEFNRRVSSLVTTLHCAPTEASATNLLNEGHSPDSVHVTGNTVIDAMLETVEREKTRPEWTTKYAFLGQQRMVLITGHRRENFGSGFENICHALVYLAEQFPDVQFVYPVHLNPQVQKPVYALLSPVQNIHLIDPVAYPEFVWLMHRSDLILTDSGGVQEEAPSIQKPVLVMRDTTERPEAVACGACELVGTDQQRICDRAASLLSDAEEYKRHQTDENPYGDGKAAKRIVDLMVDQDWSGSA